MIAETLSLVALGVFAMVVLATFAFACWQAGRLFVLIAVWALGLEEERR